MQPQISIITFADNRALTGNPKHSHFNEVFFNAKKETRRQSMYAQDIVSRCMSLLFRKSPLSRTARRRILCHYNDKNRPYNVLNNARGASQFIAYIPFDCRARETFACHACFVFFSWPPGGTIKPSLALQCNVVDSAVMVHQFIRLPRCRRPVAEGLGII